VIYGPFYHPVCPRIEDLIEVDCNEICELELAMARLTGEIGGNPCWKYVQHPKTGTPNWAALILGGFGDTGGTACDSILAQNPLPSCEEVAAIGDCGEGGSEAWIWEMSARQTPTSDDNNLEGTSRG